MFGTIAVRVAGSGETSFMKHSTLIGVIQSACGNLLVPSASVWSSCIAHMPPPLAMTFLSLSTKRLGHFAWFIYFRNQLKVTIRIFLSVFAWINRATIRFVVALAS